MPSSTNLSALRCARADGLSSVVAGMIWSKVLVGHFPGLGTDSIACIKWLAVASVQAAPELSACKRQ
jgi:hypothetical protein